MRTSALARPLFRPHPFGLRGLGTCAVESIAAKEGASYAASSGASAIATAAGAGAAAGPIGIAVGAVIGLVVGDLIGKQYLNVADMNATEANEIAAFNAYKAVMGRAPGRQFGLDAMVAVWKGANHSGLFALNNEVQCFHEGCSAHPGDPSWIDSAVNGGAQFPTFGAAVAAWEKNVPLASLTHSISYASACLPFNLTKCITPLVTCSGKQSPDAIKTAVLPGGVRANLDGLGSLNMGALSFRPTPAPVRFVVPPLLRPMGPKGGRLPPVHPAVIARHNASVLGMLSALGATCAPAVPQAVTIIDSFFIPQNQQQSTPPWAVPTNTTEHQILYDTMDAYLAANNIPSTPYVADAAAPTAATQPVLTVAAPVAACIPSSGAGAPPPQLVAPITVVSPGTATAAVNPLATPAVCATPPAIASQAGCSTTVNAATAANLNATMAAQGFTYRGTTSQGYPLYASNGLVYVYENGDLTQYSTCAQLASTGGTCLAPSTSPAAAGLAPPPGAGLSGTEWLLIAGGGVLVLYFMTRKKRSA